MEKLNAATKIQACAHAKSNLRDAGMPNFSASSHILQKSLDSNFRYFHKARKFLDDSFNNIATELVEELAAKGVNDVKEDNFAVKFIKCAVYPFKNMPIDLYAWGVGFLTRNLSSNKGEFFNKLYNGKFLQNYRNNEEIDAKKRALLGMLKAAGGNKDISLNTKKLRGNVEQALSTAFDPLKGNYDTRNERTLNRLVTGIIPAYFFANDAYNLSIENNATAEKAEENAYKRGLQEVVRTLSSAYLQFTTLGALGSTINTRQMVGPLANATTATSSEVVARLGLGKQISLKKPIEKQEFVSPDITAFVSEQKDEQPKTQKEAKRKPLLTLQNIGKFILGSVGFGLVGSLVLKKFKSSATSHTDNLSKRLSGQFIDMYKKLSFEKVEATEKELSKFVELLKNTNHKDLATRCDELIKSSVVQQGKIQFGNIEKTVRMPVFHIDIPVQALFKMPTIPFKLIGEVLLMPFKGFDKLTGFSKKIGLHESKDPLAQNKIIFDLFSDYKANCKNLDKVEFDKYLKDRLLKTFDTKASKVDNDKMGKHTKFLTSAFTTYFLIADDYNLAMQQTNDMSKAEKAGRERFIQRVFRTASQIALIDLFNSVFKIPYNSSIPGALVVAGMNTVATDCVTRVLSGTSIKRKSKEDQNQLDEKRENGSFAWYFKFIKSLSE